MRKEMKEMFKNVVAMVIFTYLLCIAFDGFFGHEMTKAILVMATIFSLVEAILYSVISTIKIQSKEISRQREYIKSRCITNSRKNRSFDFEATKLERK